MRGLTTFARYLVRSALVVCVMSLAVPCAAQDADVPTPPAAGDGRGSLFVPGGFLGFVAPVHDRVSVNVYGFYYGEVDVPVAQVDVPIRTTRFLTITPSYLYYEVPPSGLDTASQRPVGLHRHIRREPISNRRDTEVVHSRIRDLEPQHVCQEVPSD